MAEPLREEVTKVDAPVTDRLTGDSDAPFQQQFFDVPVAQGEAVRQPHGVADDRMGEPIAGKLLTAEHRAHPTSTTCHKPPEEYAGMVRLPLAWWQVLEMRTQEQARLRVAKDGLIQEDLERHLDFLDQQLGGLHKRLLSPVQVVAPHS